MEAEKYPDVFKKVVEEGNCTFEQIVNTDETSIQWKLMSIYTYVSKLTGQARGRKQGKTRFMALFCWNLQDNALVDPPSSQTTSFLMYE